MQNLRTAPSHAAAAAACPSWLPPPAEADPPPALIPAAEGDCYAWGSGGWDLIYWGNPNVRLPKGGIIRLCAAQSTAPPGSVVFRWRVQEGPQGVCRILGDTPQQCPGAVQGCCVVAILGWQWQPGTAIRAAAMMCCCPLPLPQPISTTRRASRS